MEFSCDPLPNETVVREPQLANTRSLIEVTPSGIAIETRPECANALFPILVSAFPKFTVVKDEQPLKAKPPTVTSCEPFPKITELKEVQSRKT